MVNGKWQIANKQPNKQSGPCHTVDQVTRISKWESADPRSRSSPPLSFSTLDQEK